MGGLSFSTIFLPYTLLEAPDQLVIIHNTEQMCFKHNVF